MITRVAKFIEEHKMVLPGDLVIIGVSGGPDSMALLHILNQLKNTMGFNIAVAHLNHCLRDEARAEEKFVQDKCISWGIPFYARTVSINDAAIKEKKSVEEMGREVRYKFFNDLVTELGANRIATAHHYNDVAETVLLHLLRGTGIKGLRGIMPVSGTIIRPLLKISKDEIIDYLDKNNINYCIDQSNNDATYVRNRIRHKLLPYLEQEFNPRIVDGLNQLAVIAREENQILEENCEQIWQDIIICQEKGSITLDASRLVKLLPGYRRRLILKALNILAGESGWNMEDINIIMELLTRPGSSRVIHLKKKVRVNKSYDKLIITTVENAITEFSYPVTIPGQVEILETGEVYSFNLIKRDNFKPEIDDMYLDYDKIKEPLVLRSRQPGDIFSPWGLKGHKKLKKFFIDNKIPYFERHKIPILASPEKIYAVLNYRISQVAAVSPKTKTIIVIKREGKDKNKNKS